MLLFFITIPLCAAFLISLFNRKIKNLSDFIANLATFILFLFSLSSIKLISLYKIIVYRLGGWMPPMGICLVGDGLASFMLVTVNLISFLVMIYSISYMDRYTDKWKFHALFMLMLAGMNGVILSGDLFSLYLFLEMASISAYVLVAFGTEPEDLEASFKYAIMGSIASIFILLGIGLLYSYTSTLNMADISSGLLNKPKGLLVGFVAVLFLAGFGLKSALVPFHTWLPDAHSSAPSPVSAILSGIFIKTLGIYALARIFFNILGISDKILFLFMVLGVLSMVVGALLAMAQNDIKRMLAYSSISQIGYIVFALGIGTPLALLGGLLHLFNHAVFKSLLFLNAGAIEYSTGSRKLSDLGGLNSKLPITGGTSFIGSMSIAGIPPLGGFWSKLIIIIAAVQTGHIGFAFVAVLVSIITLVYYLKFQSFVFFGKLNQAYIKVREVPLVMKLAMVFLAGISIFSGLLLTPPFKDFLQSATGILLSGTAYGQAIFGAIK
ncbi:MAG: proton-conducting transporter membrane subunit [Candidatus Omnitrophica bacterium]|nr:proton-conducting transporter membrane subunit [Candidatus Omnitrophota bacterium]